MNRLKELRIEKKLTQKELAKILNKSQNGYSQCENEINDFSTTFLKQAATYFNTSIDYILYLTDNKKSYSKSNISNTVNNMNRLKEIREDRDLTQWDIIKILGMSQPGYSQYEAYINDLPSKILIKLALFYNVPIDYLLYLTDERIPHKRR